MSSATPVSVALLALALAGCERETPTYTRDELLDPNTCFECHSQHARDWSGSMHAYAADDPVFLAMNARGQRETGGGLGSFCVKCHAPMAVREGATEDGLNLADVDPKLKGVTCYFCHTVDAVDGAHDNPLHGADDTTMRGPFADAVPNGAHGSAYSALHDRDQRNSSTLCGACHDIVTPGGVTLERTFLEWNASVFAQPNGATCGQCHMPQSEAEVAVANVPDAPLRRYHGHAVPGVDVALEDGFPRQDENRAGVQALLDQTLQSALCVAHPGEGRTSVRVLLDNVGAGHGFPSGASQDRRIWTEVIAYRGDEVIYTSGVVPDGGDVTQDGGPDLWILRDCLRGVSGDPVHMFWDAVSYTSSALTAPVTFDRGDPRYYQTHVVRGFPRGTGVEASFEGIPDRVTLRVRVVPMGHDVLEDLVESGDLDPSVIDRMPTFDIDLGDGPMLTWTPSSADRSYVEDGILPVSCVSASAFDVTADKTPAVDDTCSTSP